MRKLDRLLFISLTLGAMNLAAQQSNIYTHDLVDYQKALSLYKDKQYQAAQILFDKVKRQQQFGSKSRLCLLQRQLRDSPGAIGSRSDDGKFCRKLPDQYETKSSLYRSSTLLL